MLHLLPANILTIPTKHIRILFFLLLLFAFTQGQPIMRYNTFSYNVNDGLLQSTIGDMEYDSNNFCWISFPNGIQKFDGRSFINIPIQPGLPDDKQVRFHKCANGDLLLSHASGISKYDINSNSFILLWKADADITKPSFFIGETNGKIFILTEKAKIIELDSKTYKLTKTTHTQFAPYTNNFENIPIISRNIINGKVVIIVKNDLYLWNLKNHTPIHHVKISGNFNPIVTLLNEDEVLLDLYEHEHRTQIYNFAGKTYRPVLPKNAEKNMHFTTIIPWKGKYLVGSNGNLFVTDKDFKTIEFKFIDFQNQSLSLNSTPNKIRLDKYGNVCLTTVNDGIRKVMLNNFPIKYYSSGERNTNHVISILPDKINNKILAGTSINGVLIYDTLQNLLKHILYLPGTKEAISVNRITKSITGDYILYLSSHPKVIWLSSDLNEMDIRPLMTDQNIKNFGIGYFGNVLYEDAIGNITQTQSYVVKTNYKTKASKAYFINNFYIMSGVVVGSNLILHADDNLIYYDTSTLKEIKRVFFPNTAYVRSYIKDKQNNIYIGSNKGIFKIDTTGKIISHMGKDNGLPDECIYAMLIDKNDYLWCSSNKGIFRINRDSSIFQLRKDDGLQENEFNTNVAAIAHDGELFFGGVNGVSSFFPDEVSSMTDSIDLIVTKIRINNKQAFTDTAVWNMETIELAHDQNLISLDFVAMGIHNPDQYVYQYQMEGIDDQWIQNEDMLSVRYFLPPGKYKMKIFASRYFKSDAEPLKVIEIHVHPPFWKTWWFIFTVSCLLLLFLMFSINRYNRRKYLGKLQAMENEKKAQMERERISRDLHDNIGVFANAVLHKAEMLQLQKEEPTRKHIMEDLKTASKEIILSLRETIWAFKQATYTSEDCMLRIKNFVQSLTRYYPQIQFSINDHSPSEFTLHNTHALNLVRIIQESITNSVKHAHAKHISIHSFSENNVWTVTVSDDGVGFDEQIVQHGDGLDNMKKRAAESEFEFDIVSNPETGTTSTLRVLIKSR